MASGGVWGAVSRQLRAQARVRAGPRSASVVPPEQQDTGDTRRPPDAPATLSSGCLPALTRPGSPEAGPGPHAWRGQKQGRRRTYPPATRPWAEAAVP